MYVLVQMSAAKSGLPVQVVGQFYNEKQAQDYGSMYFPCAVVVEVQSHCWG